MDLQITQQISCSFRGDVWLDIHRSVQYSEADCYRDRFPNYAQIMLQWNFTFFNSWFKMLWLCYCIILRVAGDVHKQLWAAWHNSFQDIEIKHEAAFILSPARDASFTHTDPCAASMQKAAITEGLWVGQTQVCHWDFNQPRSYHRCLVFASLPPSLQPYNVACNTCTRFKLSCRNPKALLANNFFGGIPDSPLHFRAQVVSPFS